MERRRFLDHLVNAAIYSITMSIAMAIELAEVEFVKVIIMEVSGFNEA